jgi:hypothetical protein
MHMHLDVCVARGDGAGWNRRGRLRGCTLSLRTAGAAKIVVSISDESAVVKVTEIRRSTAVVNVRHVENRREMR